MEIVFTHVCLFNINYSYKEYHVSCVRRRCAIETREANQMALRIETIRTGA